MMSIKPKWYLSSDYGIGLDTLNWKLYRATKAKKISSTVNWRVVGYFPTLRMLVTYLQQVVLLEDSDNASLEDHVNAALERWKACSKALKEQLDTMGAGLDTKPPKYATYAKQIGANDDVPQYNPLPRK